MTAPRASIVIRAKDKERQLARVLELLAAQTVADVETIVVDSGSSDGTVAVARAAGARVIEIPSAEFTYGGALNRGAAEARADVVVALSAHSFPTDPEWLARLLDAMSGERIACASGQAVGPGGVPLDRRVLVDRDLLARDRYFGYSNHAGAFRADLWRERPFRTDMPASEDKEWAWHWAQRGWRTLIDPALRVQHTHADEGFAQQFRRAYLVWVGNGMYVPVERQAPRALVARWWAEREGFGRPWRERASLGRAGRLLGEFAGRRAARR